MHRVLVLSLVAAVLGPAAGAAEARRYVAELPRDGRLVLKVRGGEVRASFRVRLRCTQAPFRRRLEDRRLPADLKDGRFRIFGSAHGDSGDGSGTSQTLEITGRLGGGRIVGRFAYEERSFSVGPGGDSRCAFGPRRYEAPRRR